MVADSRRFLTPHLADPPEHCRLDLQHEMLKKKMNGLFLRPDAVHRALAPKQTEIPSILDVGAGSGCWALDVGKLFPHADVVGIDLAPANLKSFVKQTVSLLQP